MMTDIAHRGSCASSSALQLPVFPTATTSLGSRNGKAETVSTAAAALETQTPSKIAKEVVLGSLVQQANELGSADPPAQRMDISYTHSFA